MTFKKLTIAALLAASGSAMAADPSELTFDLEATIPADRYYVQFENPAWGTTKQTMSFDHIAEVLTPLSTNLRMKNTAGKISAYLDSAAELTQPSGPGNIPLQVSIDGKELQVGSASPVDLTTAATTAEEIKAMVVSPGSGATYTDAGDYEGRVTMVFDYEI